MYRRRLLRAAAGAGLASFGGCLGLGGVAETGTRTEAAETPTATPLPRPGEIELPVPKAEIRTALAKDQIPAVVDPAFAADWSGLAAPDDAERPLLPPDSPVVGVTREGRARAYPLRVLDWHEVVNDDFGGPLLVTYCPLCGSSVVAERYADGDPATFGVSGKLWRGDLVLYDRPTGSLWSQLLARAIRGELTGQRLSLVPSTLSSWGAWRERHPDGEVLLPPPRSNTVRGRDATYSYFGPKYHRGEDQLVGYGSGEDLDKRTLVVGIEHDGVARAYPFDAVERDDPVNDAVGGLPVVVTVTRDGSMAAYVRSVAGSTLRFRPADDRHVRAGGSRWRRASGRAVDGPHEGTRLERATETPPMFWVGWSSFYPETEVYGPPGQSTGG